MPHLCRPLRWHCVYMTMGWCWWWHQYRGAQRRVDLTMSEVSQDQDSSQIFICILVRCWLTTLSSSLTWTSHISQERISPSNHERVIIFCVWKFLFQKLVHLPENIKQFNTFCCVGTCLQSNILNVLKIFRICYEDESCEEVSECCHISIHNIGSCVKTGSWRLLECRAPAGKWSLKTYHICSEHDAGMIDAHATISSFFSSIFIQQHLSVCQVRQWHQILCLDSCLWLFVECANRNSKISIRKGEYGLS